MGDINRSGDIVELNDPPAFGYGAKVRSRRTVRNDGTFRGKDIGEILCKKGEEGYVVSIGTFLQQFYIYGVEFIGSGYRVGMKFKEIESAEPLPETGLSGSNAMSRSSAMSGEAAEGKA